MRTRKKISEGSNFEPPQGADREKIKRDGASITYEIEQREGRPGKRWIATICKQGERYRQRGKTKGELVAWVADKLTMLAREGVEAADLSAEERREVVRVRRRLMEGETITEAAEELAKCRLVLGVAREEPDEFGEMRLVSDKGGDVRGAVAEAAGELAEAWKQLKGRASLHEAVGFWRAHNPDNGGKGLGELAADYLAAPRRGKSPSHVRALQERLRTFCDTFGAGTPAARIMPGDVIGFLDGRGREEKWSDASWNAWLVTLKSFFGFGEKTFGLPNPAAAVLKRHVGPRDEIEFIPPEGVEKILRTAEEIEPEYAAAVAILFFAGLRPTELTGQYGLQGEGEVLGGLTWERVNVDGEIVLGAKDTKTRTRRTVPISANLAAWLDRYGKKRGRVVPNPQAWKLARSRIAAASGVEWGRDWARHTYATFHFAMHRDRARLEAAMGHASGGSSEVLENNYKGLGRKAEAERFWAIVPSR